MKIAAALALLTIAAPAIAETVVTGPRLRGTLGVTVTGDARDCAVEISGRRMPQGAARAAEMDRLLADWPVRIAVVETNPKIDEACVAGVIEALERARFHIVQAFIPPQSFSEILEGHLRAAAELREAKVP